MKFLKERFFSSVTLVLCVSSLFFVPKFADASDNNDTDGDGLPDANETAIGRNPNFVEMHDWVPNYDPSSDDWNASIDGNWTVSLVDNNLSVRQSMNVPVTQLISPYDLINMEANGSLQVWGNSDNDFVGIYFGYVDSLNYYHFKWSRSEDGSGTSPLDGWNLLKVENGATTRVDYNESDFSKGWEMNVEHNFSLIFTEGNMTLRVQGDNNFNSYPVLFSHEGNFSAGKFGFWTGSQQDANFSNIKFTQLHAPVVILEGDASLTHEAATLYSDANATANDDEDGNLTSLIVMTSDVNISVPGTYYVVHSVKDSSDIERNATRTVNVVDTTIPVITLNGDANMTHEATTVYADANATWTDTVDGSGSVSFTGNIDANTTGVYNLSYNHTDQAGNSAVTIIRTVNVVDSTAAVITLEGNATYTHEVGTVYTDANATWTDAVDGSGSLNFTGSFDANTTGVYALSYNHTDQAGNVALEVNRTVNVVDTTPPVISVLGGAVVTHEASTIYEDAGAVWADFVDSNDSNSTTNLNVSGTVDYSVPGNYTLVYSFTDSAGNEGNATRTITVVDSTPPVLSLFGDANFSLGVWQDFVDPGVNAEDSVDGNITSSIIPSGTVDNYTLGSYQILYTVQDAAGNEANITRVVNVVNSAPTDISLSSSSLYENMPIDTLVGSFQVTDADDPDQARQYQYEIVESNQNSPINFSIDANGGLRNLLIFNFESVTSSSILVRVTDEFGASFEKQFQISISDASIPVIDTTLSPTVGSDGTLQVGISLVDAGGDADLLEWGVLVSSTSIDDLGSEGVQKLQLSYNSETSAVVTNFLPGDTWDTVYARAYALNDEGVSYGLEEYTDYSEQYLAWADASPMTGLAGWWESEWFGNLYLAEGSPWAMHAELGWIYPIASDDGSVWIWQDGWGWSWTSPEAYPFFYSTDSDAWRYFFGKVGGNQVFYDYGKNAWADLPQTDSP